MTFIFEEYVEAGDSHLPCAVQEIDNLSIEDKSAETDDKKVGLATYKPNPKYNEQCSVWSHTTTSSVACLMCQSQSSETSGNWEILLLICLKDEMK